ncbi:MAG: NADH-ubiquinone/plastoquinone oxidoreductase subunit 6 [Chloroflexi bacterium OLB15]|nr:MAG: NADH-ubiquinone/plastoquinone oxidoreductase subunit 6 [Chloroflexi bacterium OLB15]
MTELWLFIIVGAVAVAAAVMMLLSENAVHSALFLIVTMVGISLLFLMLNSPFLAMIQITVYAGAIMVLFLFVIMLLGAEKLGTADPGPAKSRFRWFTPVVLALALGLLFTIGLATIQGNIDDKTPALAPAEVRVVNAANNGPIDVYVGSLLVADDLPFGQATEFSQIQSGQFTVSVRPISGGEVTAAFTSTEGVFTNIIAYGTGEQPEVALAEQDFSPVFRDGDTRVTIFNAITGTEAVTLVDAHSLDTNTDVYVNTIIANLPAHTVSSVEVPAGDVNWRVVRRDDASVTVVDLTDQPLRSEQNTLIVLADETLSETDSRVLPVVVSTTAQAEFGSPRAIGYSLFTQFMLPFQVLGLLLLAAMVGVIVIVQRELKPKRKQQQRRKVSRSLTNVIAAQVGQEVVEEDVPQLPQSTPETEAEPAN